MTGWDPDSQSVCVLCSFSFSQPPCSNWPWLMASAAGVWGEDGDRLLPAGLESSRSHGNTAKGVENNSDWSDGWRWGVLLCCCLGKEALDISENWSRCWWGEGIDDENYKFICIQTATNLEKNKDFNKDCCCLLLLQICNNDTYIWRELR